MDTFVLAIFHCGEMKSADKQYERRSTFKFVCLIETNTYKKSRPSDTCKYIYLHLTLHTKLFTFVFRLY